MASKVPLIMTVQADVMRDDPEKKGEKKAQRIEAGQLVDDLDLTDDELADFRTRGYIRPATEDEVTRAEAAKQRAEQAEENKKAELKRQDEEAAKERDAAKGDAKSSEAKTEGHRGGPPPSSGRR